jgi:hypothetical protein
MDHWFYGVSLQLQAKIIQPREIFKLIGLRRRPSAPGQNPPVYGEREKFKLIDHAMTIGLRRLTSAPGQNPPVYRERETFKLIDHWFTASHFSSRPKSSSLGKYSN